jgi:small-conductance mechanosensitive channel
MLNIRIYQMKTNAYFILTTVLLCLYTFSTTAFAQGDRATEVVSPPSDILTLKADWWHYFENKNVEKQQKEIVFIKKLIQQTPQKDKNKDLYKTTFGVLTLYKKVISAKQNIENPWLDIKTNSNVFHLKDIIKSQQKLDALKYSLKNHRYQNEQQKAVIEQGKNALQMVKINYLEQENINERYNLGLQLIHDRLLVAIAEHRLKALYKKEKKMAAFIETGSLLKLSMEKKLKIEDSETKKTVRKIKKIKKDLIIMGKLLAKEKLKFFDAEGYVQEIEDKKSLHLLNIEELEIKWTVQQAELHQLQLKLDLGLLLNHPEDTSTENLKRSLASVENFGKKWVPLLNERRNKINKERSLSSNRLLTLVKNKNKELIEINTSRYKKADEILSLLEKLQHSIKQQDLLFNLLTQRLHQQEGLIGDYLSSFNIYMEEQWDYIKNSLHEPLFEVNSTPVTLLGVIRFFVILFVAWVVSKFIRITLQKLAKSKSNDNNIAFVLSKILHYIILLFAFLIALSSLNIDVTRFALLASALSIGIGFGLQNIVSNFVSGIILLFEKSIKVNDFIEFESGVKGKVREMNIRSTVITTNDNIDIVVPNEEFVNGYVTNWTMTNSIRRIRINFGVAYNSNRHLVHNIVKEAALEMPYTLRENAPEPQVRLINFGDNSLDFQLLVWIKPDVVRNPGRMQSAYLWAIADVLDDNGIEVPFPQRDINIRSYVDNEAVSFTSAQNDIDDIKTDIEPIPQRGEISHFLSRIQKHAAS